MKNLDPQREKGIRNNRSVISRPADNVEGPTYTRIKKMSFEIKVKLF